MKTLKEAGREISEAWREFMEQLAYAFLDYAYRGVGGRVVVEKECEHGRMQAHGVAGVIHGEGVPECYGGKWTVVYNPKKTR